jgi:lipoprotein-anchoring transpeptidase ErfK/SrfK
LLFICAAMGLTLGSAAPPPPAPAAVAAAPSAPRLARTVLEAVPGPAAEAQLAAPAAAAPALAAPAPVAPAAAEAAAPKPRAQVRRPGGVRVLVSLPLQRLWVFRGRELVATSPVSTGKRGHETPAGSFPILQKRVEHYSNRYDNAPMPYMQRLTHYGIALHGGRLPGYPASHGCIRLPHRFARRLYNLTDFGSRVIVTRARPRSTEQALSLTL